MPEPRAARYREVFAVAEFRALFVAHLLSVVGDQFARVALAVLVFARTGSAALTALTYALTFLPAVVAGPLLSGLADRYPRRQVMVVTDVARAALVAVMAVPGVPLVGLGALLVVVQLLAAPFDAARAATLPLVLHGDRYVVASAVSNMTYQLAQLLGFAVGGLLVAAVNPSGALLLDAGTFLLSALLIRLGIVHRPAPAVAQPKAGAAGWGRRLGEGARLVWAERKLRMLVALLCVTAFPVTVEGLAVPYADEIGAGPAAVGLLFAADPAGSLLGMLMINRISPAKRLRLMRPLAVSSCAVLVLCAAQPGIVITLVLWTLSGVASAYFIPANAEFIRAVPDSLRGQAFGLASTAIRVSQGVAVLAAGAAADMARPAVVIATAGALGAMFAWWVATALSRATTSADTGSPAEEAS
jgi:Major Facilitator Superfamily